MINNKRVVALIPAKGMSQRLKSKNMKKFNGKPLIHWSIEASRNSSLIDKVYVSSEDEKILKFATQYKNIFIKKRSESLSKSYTKSEDVILDLLSIEPNYNIIVLIQPTSPLRTSQDIDDCITKLENSNKKFCMSVSKYEKKPNWIFKMKKDRSSLEELNIKNSLSLNSEFYILNGAVYCFDINYFIKKRKIDYSNFTFHVMPKHRSIDIDDSLDFDFAEFLIKKS